MPDIDKGQVVPRPVVVLQRDVYKALEAKVSRLGVNQQTTDLMAGYQLGVEAVLRELRNGLVSGGN